jgi:hypothetical protein
MTGIVLLIGIAFAAYVLIARHLSTVAKPPCVHQRVRVLDGETDQCARCGERVS